MGRDETVEYEQDRYGNENKKLDTLRAQEGMSGADESGIVEVGSAGTGTMQILQSKPTHADEMIGSLVHAHNSVPSGGNTFSLYELDLDVDGNITGQTRRSVPVRVTSGSTRAIGYEGESFEKAIGVKTEFQGVVGIAVISDHKEHSEPNSQEY